MRAYPSLSASNGQKRKSISKDRGMWHDKELLWIAVEMIVLTGIAGWVFFSTLIYPFL